MAGLVPVHLDRIVIVMPSWVGDVVMATPVLRAIAEHRPGVSIVAIVRPGQESLLEGCPWISQAIGCPSKGVRGVFRLASAIRVQKPGAVLLLPNSFRAALAARLSNRPNRIGYDRDGRGFLLTGRIVVQKTNQPVSTVLYYRHLAAKALGIDDDAVDPTLQLHTTDAQQQAADQLLRDVDATKKLVVLNPGGVRTNKRWPAANFAAVADALAHHNDAVCAITGAPSERVALDDVLAAAHTNIFDLAARGVTLGSLKAVLQRASLLITNDTGPRHIAAAVGTPAVSLFGPTDHRWTTLPGVNERILLAEPFLPEKLVADQHAELCTIDRIRVSDVLAAADAFLHAPRLATQSCEERK